LTAVAWVFAESGHCARTARRIHAQLGPGELPAL
jgi:hypothetical protein